LPSPIWRGVYRTILKCVLCDTHHFCFISNISQRVFQKKHLLKFELKKECFNGRKLVLSPFRSVVEAFKRVNKSVFWFSDNFSGARYKPHRKICTQCFGLCFYVVQHKICQSTFMFLYWYLFDISNRLLLAKFCSFAKTLIRRGETYNWLKIVGSWISLSFAKSRILDIISAVRGSSSKNGKNIRPLC